MQACLIYGPNFQTFFKGALSSPPATPGYQPLRRPNGRGFQCVCQFSRVFEHVKAPKKPRKTEKKKINKKKIIIIINIAASSDGGPKPGGTATPVASGQLCTAGNRHLKRLNIKGLCQIHSTFTALQGATIEPLLPAHFQRITCAKF